MQLYPNLTFNGQCEEAFQLYEKCLGGKITFMMKYADAPSLEHPPEWAAKIAHATFALGDQLVSGSDALPGSYEKPRGFAMQFNLADAAAADRIFETLSEKGVVKMPLQETFWALRFGGLVDQFGIEWAINCEKAA